jgi:hypothetical protein
MYHLYIQVLFSHISVPICLLTNYCFYLYLLYKQFSLPILHSIIQTSNHAINDSNININTTILILIVPILDSLVPIFLFDSTAALFLELSSDYIPEISIFISIRSITHFPTDPQNVGAHVSTSDISHCTSISSAYNALNDAISLVICP